MNSRKYQSIATQNGLFANLFGPVDGYQHDSGMLADSNVCKQSQ